MCARPNVDVAVTTITYRCEIRSGYHGCVSDKWVPALTRGDDCGPALSDSPNQYERSPASYVR